MGKISKKIKELIQQPLLIPLRLIPRRILPDTLALKLLYRIRTGKRLNLQNPLSFNEKIQWLKLHDRKPEYTHMVDKYEARKYVEKIIGEEYLIPLYGVWDTFEEIPFDTLPNKFVLKCTHDSGGIILCNDKQSFDMQKARDFFKKRLAKNFYWHSREWPYKDIKPRIIAEKYLTVDLSANESINDYKIFCFDGEPKIIQVDLDRFTNHKRNFYSPEWIYQNIKNERPNIPLDMIQKPVNLELMLLLAKKLSAATIHMRVDLYSVNEKVYFGEITLSDGGGFNIYEPPEWDKIFGDWMTLPCQEKT